ncbi:MAG: 16S rRNA (guanine(527)-N(7))-methyltransferase RsmG [Clostridia bacterium]|nr:16S rRNA (guanine(527)-N(7))-methyltransferase RsmG [Clostridia bacterium]
MDDILTIFKKYNIEINDNQAEQFDKYYNLLIEYNAKFNLTTIINRKDCLIKHFIDSVLPYKDMLNTKSICDIGSGAGFPGIPLKILLGDNTKIVLVDSLNKRVNFLNTVIKELSLNNIEAIHARAEDLSQNYRGYFDIIVSRAVAGLPTLLEYTIPFVKVNGYFIGYKSDVREEIINSANALKVLNSSIEKIDKYMLENEMLRNIIFVKKKKSTELKYPRKMNKPRLSPL